jgi:hypothetical protein
MTPTIVFPALYVGSRELYHSLLTMPDYVLPVVEPSFLERTGYRGECLVDDFRDPARLLAKLDGWSRSKGRPITGVIGIDDEDQFAVPRAVARHFGVGFYDDVAVSVASNKFLQKCRFVCHGVPTGNFVLAEASNPKGGEALGFPSVVKTLTGSGSEYVFLNRDAGELADNVRYLRESLEHVEGDPRYRLIPGHVPGKPPWFDTRREFLVEEYLSGDEFSADFLCQDGRVRPLRLVKKLKGGPLGSFGGFYLLNLESASDEGVDLHELQRLGGRLAGALGVWQRGVMMVDMINGPYGLRVLEASIRPGLSTFVALMERLYGYTSLGVAARLAAGEPVDVAIPDVEGLAVYLRAGGPGVVERIDVSGLEALRKDLDIIDVWLYAKAGDVVIDAPHDHIDLILGYVLVKDPGRERVERVAEALRGACAIEMGRTS